MGLITDSTRTSTRTSTPIRGPQGRAATAIVGAAILALGVLAPATSPEAGWPAASSELAAASAPSGHVIVRTVPGGSDRVAAWLGAQGVAFTHLASIDLVEVTTDAELAAELLAHPDVVAVTADDEVELHSSSFLPKDDAGFTRRVGYDVVKIHELWKDGFFGQGIDVALIDSGVVPVKGLDLPGKVLHGPDLSFESQVPGLEHLDTYGHGTHLGGLIAGLDEAALMLDDPKDAIEAGAFVGMAPGARLVSVKVADNGGTTDVSQVLAAIDWVVQNRNVDGLNIRVLNLAFGTESTQPASLDPLAYAAEVAWDHGIVVVAAAGNAGNGSNGLDSPAYTHGVLAVGAAEPEPGKSGRGDYELASYSSCGDTSRSPDVLAPGTSLVSLRSPGSNADLQHATTGAVTDRYFRGTGTSQAAAIVSGGVAALLSGHPELTPDDVRVLLQREAYDIDAPVICGGAGLVDFKEANDHVKDLARFWEEFAEDRADNLEEIAEDLADGDVPDEDELDQVRMTDWMDAEAATGLGSLDASRGGVTIYDEIDGELVGLTGEVDIFGEAWDAVTWKEKTRQGKSWENGKWNGSSWSGSSWSGSSWSGSNWSGSNWSGSSWSGSSWSGSSWSGSSWSGSSWSGSSWSGSNWSGSSWSGSSWSDWFWSGNRWSGNAWSGDTWSTVDWS